MSVKIEAAKMLKHKYHIEMEVGWYWDPLKKNTSQQAPLPLQRPVDQAEAVTRRPPKR